ncbi:MAG: nuclear protein [Vezdaea aestivalis]|nr:MAG: nuclear protein [Vezdaea aestivalis]
MARAQFRSSVITTDNAQTSSTRASSAASFSSDKENRDSLSGSAAEKSSRPPTSSSGTGLSVRNKTGQSPPLARMMDGGSSKRRKVSGRVTGSRGEPSDERDPTAFYDPDQPLKEQREVSKALRDLTTELNENSREVLNAGNDGIRQTILKSNALMNSVKQTTNATIDSNLLVNAAELSLKKAAALRLGSGNTNVDVDEFVSKCRSFMGSDLQTPFTAPQSSSTRRSSARFDSDTNWHIFGFHACFPCNSRPCIPSFLLGPLSLVPRQRAQPNRRATNKPLAQIVRPIEIRASDVEANKTKNNVKVRCQEIGETLRPYLEVQRTKATSVVKMHKQKGDTVSTAKVMFRYGLDMGGISLFKFAINPNSFGQSVENLFYISFLIREGTIAVLLNEHDLPYIVNATSHSAAEMREKNIQKAQAVFNLDYETWRKLIEVFDIQESAIPDRSKEEAQDRESAQAVGGKGWY